MFGERIVDCHDGILQHAVLGHGAQADDAGGGLFGAAHDVRRQVLPLAVQQRNQVRAVVHGDVRGMFGRRRQVLVVDVVVFALDGVDRNAVIAHQNGGYVILGGQRIGGAQHHGGPGIAQRDHQVGGLAGHVQAGGNALAGQRLGLDELLADGLQHGHELERPVRAPLAQIRQGNILDVTGNLRLSFGWHDFLC